MADESKENSSSSSSSSSSSYGDTRDFITAKVLADSIDAWGNRLTTLELWIPLPTLNQLGTHRKFSRNSASSRAVPVARRIELLRKKPYVPWSWGENNPGMSSKRPLSKELQEEATRLWIEAREQSIIAASQLAQLGERGVHKQWPNRLLEPYLMHQMLVSSTDFDNFFALRVSEEAQPEMKFVAERIRDAISSSTPRLLHPGEWHIPYLDEMDASLKTEDKIKVGVARCARVSFENLAQRDPELDFKLHDRLLENHHMSPFEHVARVPQPHERELPDFRLMCGNFDGWIQYRKIKCPVDPGCQKQT